MLHKERSQWRPPPHVQIAPGPTVAVEAGRNGGGPSSMMTNGHFHEEGKQSVMSRQNTNTVYNSWHETNTHTQKQKHEAARRAKCRRQNRQIACGSYSNSTFISGETLPMRMTPSGVSARRSLNREGSMCLEPSASDTMGHGQELSDMSSSHSLATKAMCRRQNCRVACGSHPGMPCSGGSHPA